MLNASGGWQGLAQGGGKGEGLELFSGKLSLLFWYLVRGLQPGWLQDCAAFLFGMGLATTLWKGLWRHQAPFLEMRGGGGHPA